MNQLMDMADIGKWRYQDGQLYLENMRFYERFGISQVQIDYREWLALMSANDRDFMTNLYKDREASDQAIEGIAILKDRHGQEVWIRTVSLPFYDKEGKLLALTGHHINITDKHHYQEHIHQLAYHQSLTGLENLGMLEFKLYDPMVYPDLPHLVMFGIAGYGHFYDRYGRKASEKVVLELSVLLSHYCDDHVSLYHIDRDEFALLVKPTSAWVLEDLFWPYQQIITT